MIKTVRRSPKLDGLRNGHRRQSRTFESGTTSQHLESKQFVMFALSRLFRDGCAKWRLFDNGEVELRVISGEIFRLGETTITRMA